MKIPKAKWELKKMIYEQGKRKEMSRHWASTTLQALCWPLRAQMNMSEQCPGAAGGLGKKPGSEALGQAAKLNIILEARVNAMGPEGETLLSQSHTEDTQLAVCGAKPLLLRATLLVFQGCLLTLLRSCRSQGADIQSPLFPKHWMVRGHRTRHQANRAYAQLFSD